MPRDAKPESQEYRARVTPRANGAARVSRTVAAASVGLSVGVVGLGGVAGGCGSGASVPGPSAASSAASGGSAAGGGTGSSGSSGGGAASSGAWDADGAAATTGSSTGGANPNAGNDSSVGVSHSGAASAEGGACAVAASTVRITEVDLGGAYAYDETDANGPALGLAPLVISPIPGGGSRLGWMGGDGQVHVTQLDANDRVAGPSLALPAFDFQDLVADDRGGVLLVSRASAAGGTGHCGSPSNLCGTPPNPPDPCFDLMAVRFDGTAETWATKLTDSSATSPPYLTSPTDPKSVVFIWWYAHNGRIAFDGSNYAAYFGAAISVSQGGCVNVHQGDRMKVVSSTGALKTGGFDWGCSHSGYERVVWDARASRFVAVCKNDLPDGSRSGRLAFAPQFATSAITPVDLSYADFGSLLVAGGAGYWLVTSDIRSGQLPNSSGLADIHLLHTTTGAADRDLVLASDPGLNDRAPHLAAYGPNQMLAAWETSTVPGDLTRQDASRKLVLQALDSTTGAAQGSPYSAAGVTGSRYQDFRSYPDGSVAYAAPGSSATKVKILRILPCP
ncbi:MAG: hypothetical protein M3O50_10630 [Myxococcota bacterium]|nr:hypothetical protein [Myxococcota bacterium]